MISNTNTITIPMPKQRSCDELGVCQRGPDGSECGAVCGRVQFRQAAAANRPPLGIEGPFLSAKRTYLDWLARRAVVAGAASFLAGLVAGVIAGRV